jgi:hypothetical protein
MDPLTGENRTPLIVALMILPTDFLTHLITSVFL